MNNRKRLSIKCHTERAKSVCNEVEIELSHLVADLSNRVRGQEGEVIISGSDIDKLITKAKEIREANRRTFYWVQHALDEALTDVDDEITKRDR